MKFRKIAIALFILFLLGGFAFLAHKYSGYHPFREVGQEIDSLNGVAVYYNGNFGNVVERNLTESGYNLGLKYQCVEFVKRYYYEELQHKMPNSYGHAKDFYNPQLKDGQLNKDRDLLQFTNSGSTKPKVNDLLVFRETSWNPYGHVAIISKVSEDEIEIIQQNVSSSREEFDLVSEYGLWTIEHPGILGWLRKKD